MEHLTIFSTFKKTAYALLCRNTLLFCLLRMVCPLNSIVTKGVQREAARYFAEEEDLSYRSSSRRERKVESARHFHSSKVQGARNRSVSYTFLHRKSFSTWIIKGLSTNTGLFKAQKQGQYFW